MDTEAAYKFIANRLLEEYLDEKWDYLVSVYELDDNYASITSKRIYNGVEYTSKRMIPVELRSAATRSALFIRDNMRSSTGDLISEIRFTLNSDETFNITYSYTS